MGCIKLRGRTYGREGFYPTKTFARLQLKPRSGWVICGAVGCLEIGKYLRRVGADRTILYRNLDRTYMMDFDDMPKRHHAVIGAGLVKEEEERRGDIPYSGTNLWASASPLVRAEGVGQSVGEGTGSVDLDRGDVRLARDASGPAACSL